MPFLPTNPERPIFKELLAKYPRRGILLFKLLEDSKNNGPSLNKGVQEMVITYVSALNDPDSGVLALRNLYLMWMLMGRMSINRMQARKKQKQVGN